MFVRFNDKENHLVNLNNVLSIHNNEKSIDEKIKKNPDSSNLSYVIRIIGPTASGIYLYYDIEEKQIFEDDWDMLAHETERYHMKSDQNSKLGSLL